MLPTTGPGAADLQGLGLGESDCVPYTVAKFLLADEHQPPALPAELQDASAQPRAGGLGFGGKGENGVIVNKGASEVSSGNREGISGGGGGAFKGVNGGSVTDGSEASRMSEGVSDVAFSPVFSAGLGPTHKPLSTAKISVDNLMSPVHSMLQVGRGLGFS